MKYLCCNCGKTFEGPASKEARECTHCKSKDESDHIPEICTPIDMISNE